MVFLNSFIWYDFNSFSYLILFLAFLILPRSIKSNGIPNLTSEHLILNLTSDHLILKLIMSDHQMSYNLMLDLVYPLILQPIKLEMGKNWQLFVYFLIFSSAICLLFLVHHLRHQQTIKIDLWQIDLMLLIMLDQKSGKGTKSALCLLLNFSIHGLEKRKLNCS